MEDRWQLVLPHREYLLRLAMSRGVSRADAEDCVQEAMLRAAQYAELDESRVAAFLTTVVVRLCADTHRARARDDRLAVKLSGYDGVEPAADERVCEQAEAEWVSTRVAALPERQRLVLTAKADGQAVGEIADRLAVSYKVVESALSRARAHLRATLVASLGVLGVLVRRSRGPAAAATSVTLVALGTATLVLRGPAGDGTSPGGRGTVREGVGPVAAGAAVAGAAGGTGAVGLAPHPVAAPTPRPGRPGGPQPGRTEQVGPVRVSAGPTTQRPVTSVVDCARNYWIDPDDVAVECRSSRPPGAIYVFPSPLKGPE